MKELKVLELVFDSVNPGNVILSEAISYDIKDEVAEEFRFDRIQSYAKFKNLCTSVNISTTKGQRVIREDVLGKISILPVGNAVNLDLESEVYEYVILVNRSESPILIEGDSKIKGILDKYKASIRNLQ